MAPALAALPAPSASASASASMGAGSLGPSKPPVFYAGYLRPLVDHLIAVKLRHWDGGLRELAAEVRASSLREKAGSNFLCLPACPPFHSPLTPHPATTALAALKNRP